MARCFTFIEANLTSLSRGSSHWFFAIEAVVLRDAVKLLDELRPKPGRFTPTMQITVMTFPVLAVSYGQVLRTGLVSPKFGKSTLVRTNPCSSLFASSKEERKTKCRESETWYIYIYKVIYSRKSQKQKLEPLKTAKAAQDYKARTWNFWALLIWCFASWTVYKHKIYNRMLAIQDYEQSSSWADTVYFKHLEANWVLPKVKNRTLRANCPPPVEVVVLAIRHC